MPKYLIQDIIPPERKRRSAPVTEAPVHAPKTHPDQRSVTISHGEKSEHTRSHAPAHHTKEHATRIMPREVDSEPHFEAHHVAPLHIAHPEPRPKHHVEDVSDAITTPKYFDETLTTPTLRQRGAMVHHLGTTPPPEDTTSSVRNWLPWIFGFASVVALVLFGLNFFGGAVVTVTPKKDSLPLDLKLSAFKNPTSTELPFSVMRVDLEEAREVPAVGEKTVTEKASGKIVVYNTQNTTQRLIKNTRFQSSAGKIYRITDSINVPKASVSGGKTNPGSIEVTIYADEAGPDWNSPPTDFTLPGLKGSPTFSKVYARSKGSIEGGASGTLKSVSDADMKTARDELRVQLETKLRTKARSDLAPSQISYDTGIIVELGEPALSKLEASGPDKAVVVQKGTLYMVTFDKESLTKTLVGLLINTYKGESVMMTNLEALSLSVPKMSGTELWEIDRLDIAMQGNPELEWSIDEEGIKKALLGVPEKNFKVIMAQFPTIENAEGKVDPFWKRTYPLDPKNITVKITPTP
jgi:hypothetical protein